MRRFIEDHSRTAARIFMIFCVVHLCVAMANLKAGFDYDDTISFSTPAFDKGFETVNEGVEAFSPDFWSAVNRNHGLESVKAGVLFWAVMLKSLGFDIVFIASRLPQDSEGLVDRWDWLHDGFYFEKEKSRILARQRFVVFIGDSDSDIEDAQKAGVWAVRARRSPRSSYQANYSPGKYNEWILPFSG